MSLKNGNNNFEPWVLCNLRKKIFNALEIRACAGVAENSWKVVVCLVEFVVKVLLLFPCSQDHFFLIQALPENQQSVS